jgi:hypothetical protein
LQIQVFQRWLLLVVGQQVAAMGTQEQLVDLVEEVLVVVQVTLDPLRQEPKVHIVVMVQPLDMQMQVGEGIMLWAVTLMPAVAVEQVERVEMDQYQHGHTQLQIMVEVGENILWRDPHIILLAEEEEEDIMLGPNLVMVD